MALLAVRLFLLASAAFLLGISLFIHEDEECKIQSKIEAWGTKLEDYRSGAVAIESNV
jgi:hypothetical protein